MFTCLTSLHVRAITRVATAETEQDFIDLAQHATALQIERLTRAPCVRKMQLPPEEAAIIWAAIASAAGASGASAEASGAALSQVEGPGASAEAHAAQSSRIPDPQPREEQRADALVDVARAYLNHQSRTLGSSHELVIITTKQQLEHGPGGVGGYLRDGTPIPLHVARMLAVAWAGSIMAPG